MSFTIGLAQCAHPADGDVIALVSRFAHEAARQSASLLLFPECLMTPFEKTPCDFRASAEPLDGPFSQAVAHIAREYGLWVIYTMNERNDAAAEGGHACALPYNTAVVVDDKGMRRGFYRKAHLYDALAVRESDRMSPGDAPAPVIDAPFGKIGLGICYDLRFPEVARACAIGGCDLFVLPAAWVDGPCKASQWKTLLAARAIENEMYVAGLCRVDERYVGESLVVDPMGRAVAQSTRGAEELLVASIDVDLVRKTRSDMPVFEHRRVDLY